jgi:hypothetical protein
MTTTTGLELQNVSGNPLSLYGEKFADWSARSNWTRQGSANTNWLGRKWQQNVIKLTMTRGTIEEIDYEGHQILVIGYHWEYQYYIDTHGLRIYDVVEVQNATLEPEIHQVSNYYAMGYKHSDLHTDLEWNGQNALFSMVYTSTSSKSTFKKAMKRIDLENKLLAVKDELIKIADDRWNGGFTHKSDFSPYNTRIGEYVFIQAHGRLRRGIIVDTTGSRFIVGYVTPSNHKEMKYKALPLYQMFVLP